MNANIFALLQQHFPADSNAPFLSEEGKAALTYGDIDRSTARIAGLLSSLGVQLGDRVAVQTEKSVGTVLLYLACLRMGAVYLPLNTAYTAVEVDYFISDAEAKLLVCRPENRAELEPIAKKAGVAALLSQDSDGLGELAERADAATPDARVAECAPSDLAALLYTSGTTGRSKGAMLTHGNLSSNALALHRIWGWRPGDVLLHALPIFHVHGLFVALHTAMLNGSKILFLKRFDADAILRLLPKATVMMGVPTFYVRLLERPELGKELVSNMRLFIAGSAPLLNETFNSFKARTGHRILERYGMTEAGMITSNPLNGERLAGTVGYALPDVEVRIANDDGMVLEQGEIGVLEVRGPNVFKGYWRMPEKTTSEFRPDGFFISGDVAKMEADGRVSIVGRAKDLIISGGFNVYPKEIELAIDALPGVRESAVIGSAHPDFGEAVVAVVVPDGSHDMREQDIIAGLCGQLAKFKLPKRVFLVKELPRNSMGKVQKNQLRDQYTALICKIRK